MDIMAFELAEIAIAAYVAKGYKVQRVGGGMAGGRFATFYVTSPDGAQTFTFQVEEN